MVGLVKWHGRFSDRKDSLEDDLEGDNISEITTL
jgi:hypothetical protein